MQNLTGIFLFLTAFFVYVFNGITIWLYSNILSCQHLCNWAYWYNKSCLCSRVKFFCYILNMCLLSLFWLLWNSNETGVFKNTYYFINWLNISFLITFFINDSITDVPHFLPLSCFLSLVPLCCIISWIYLQIALFWILSKLMFNLAIKFLIIFIIKLSWVFCSFF